MPCTYIESPEEIAAQKTKEKNAIVRPIRTELNKVTRLLCEVMTEISKPYFPERKLKELQSALVANQDLQDWWIEHQKRDASRKK